MYVCVYMYAHTYIHAVLPISIHPLIHMSSYIHPSIHTYIHKNRFMYVFLHTLNIYMYRLMHVWIHTYLDTCRHIYTCESLPTYIYTFGLLPPYKCTCIHIYDACTHTYIYRFIHACLYTIHMYIPTYSCMSGCINMDVNTYIYTPSTFTYIIHI